MTDLTLEVKVREKTLNIGESKFDLESSFFYAGLVGDIDDGDLVLELKYRNKGPGFINDEAERAYNFLEGEGLHDRIEVNSAEHGENFPTVVLMGKYKAVIRG